METIVNCKKCEKEISKLIQSIQQYEDSTDWVKSGYCSHGCFEQDGGENDGNKVDSKNGIDAFSQPECTEILEQSANEQFACEPFNLEEAKDKLNWFWQNTWEAWKSGLLNDHSIKFKLKTIKSFKSFLNNNDKVNNPAVVKFFSKNPPLPNEFLIYFNSNKKLTRMVVTNERIWIHFHSQTFISFSWNEILTLEYEARLKVFNLYIKTKDESEHYFQNIVTVPNNDVVNFMLSNRANLSYWNDSEAKRKLEYLTEDAKQEGEYISEQGGDKAEQESYNEQIDQSSDQVPKFSILSLIELGLQSYIGLLIVITAILFTINLSNNDDRQFTDLYILLLWSYFAAGLIATLKCSYFSKSMTGIVLEPISVLITFTLVLLVWYSHIPVSYLVGELGEKYLNLNVTIPENQQGIKGLTLNAVVTFVIGWVIGAVYNR